MTCLSHVVHYPQLALPDPTRRNPLLGPHTVDRDSGPESSVVAVTEWVEQRSCLPASEVTP